MNKIISIIIILLIGVAFLFALKDRHTSEPIKNEAQTATSSATNDSKTIEVANNFIEKINTFTYNAKKIQYLLILPADYSQTSNQWPLIFFLHGSSGRGSDLNLVKNYGPPFIAEKQPDFPFVVLAPQCPDGEYWTSNSDMLIALLDDILKRYRIDKNRVYLTGTSMGGNGTWYLAYKHPEYFAAIAPLASSPTIPSTLDKRFISMPTWAFHGEKDPICSVKDDEAMISTLRRHGGTPRFTVLPDQGHYIAGKYKDKELYDWFLANTRQQ